MNKWTKQMMFDYSKIYIELKIKMSNLIKYYN